LENALSKLLLIALFPSSSTSPNIGYVSEKINLIFSSFAMSYLIENPTDQTFTSLKVTNFINLLGNLTLRTLKKSTSQILDILPPTFLLWKITSRSKFINQRSL
jgi:hypothetical protein